MATSEREAQRILPPEQAMQTFRAPKRTRYDLVVIGGGSAGLSAVGIAAALGARVALLDRAPLGGECLYSGCVPSKALLHVARLAGQARHARTLGLDLWLEPVDLAAVGQYVQRAIHEIYDDTDAPEHYQRLGADVVFGEPRFVGRDALTINGQRITAKRFLLCTGSHARVPDTPGLAEAGYQTNETIFSLRALPRRLVVIGGGPIGCELGQAFARLGAEVTIVQRGERLLPKDDPEASALLSAQLTREGITVLTGANVTAVTRRDGLKVLSAQGPDGPREVVADELLVAVGRAPNVDGLDLDAAGVRYDARTGVTVDAYLRTSNPRIYAAGDVTGGYLFTHAAALQARAATRNALIPVRARLDERVMPWATFTSPEVAHVGLGEAEARKQHGDDVRVYTQRFKEVDRAVTDDATDGFTKLIATKNGKLLGAQLVGEAAGEVINELALALHKRLTLADLAETTHVYPTIALSVQQAAGKYSIERTLQSGVVKLLRRLNG